MKPNDKLDTLIREALSQEEAEFYEKLGEPPVHEMVTDLFSGRYRWLNLMTIPVMTAFLILAVYGGYRFYTSAEIPEMLRWGGLALVCLGVVTALKIWAWMEIQKNAVTRELKRVELQLANLAGKLGGP